MCAANSVMNRSFKSNVRRAFYHSIRPVFTARRRVHEAPATGPVHTSLITHPPPRPSCRKPKVIVAGRNKYYPPPPSPNTHTHTPSEGEKHSCARSLKGQSEPDSLHTRQLKTITHSGNQSGSQPRDNSSSPVKSYFGLHIPKMPAAPLLQRDCWFYEVGI